MSNAVTSNAMVFAAGELGCDAADLVVQMVDGGYSRNRKSLVGADGRWLFVKEVDVSLLPNDGSEELGWLKKEYGLTQYLRAEGYTIVPEWSTLSDDGTILLLPAYRAEEGWQWGYPTDSVGQKTYIDAVVGAVKTIEDTAFPPESMETYSLQPFFRDELALDEGYDLLLTNEAIHTQIANKLSALIDAETGSLLGPLRELLFNEEELAALGKIAKRLIDQPSDAFGHCDVRGDNLAYNVHTGEVKFVDWNWASFGPNNFGTTEFLVDIALSGIDVTPWKSYLNRELLAAFVGYFVRRCIKDPLMPGDNLRERQAMSAAAAYKLFRQMGPM